MTTPATIGRKLTQYRRKRDFRVTGEPRGGMIVPRLGRPLTFVIQKHAASHLHFDLRLELGGVMKSWAVPKGPSLDSAVRRLAMEVEDHPIEYNTFEGTIPRGEYGGGTVMLWDRGTFEPLMTAADTDPETVLRRDCRRGRISVRLFGERLRGAYSLVRLHRDDAGGKPQWLLLKTDDAFARPDSDIVAETSTSVVSGRTMEQIAADSSSIWRSNRPAHATRRVATAAAVIRPQGTARPSPPPPTVIGRTLTPMLATIGREIPHGEEWTFEPKYDGIRILAFVADGSVALLSRNGNAKTAQFPEVVAALSRLSRTRKRPFILDGEIVALDGKAPARFQELQARMHATDPRAIAAHQTDHPVAYVVFDLLLDGNETLTKEPQHVRREHLLHLLSPPVPHVLRVSDSLSGDGEALINEARAHGWEGVIAKRADAQYEPGKRSRAWIKLKIEQRQEFVVGGFTEPRNARQHLGAILLGYYDDAGNLVYAGHTGGGFSRASLESMFRRLAVRQRKSSPFIKQPRTNERAHWVRPDVVVEVKFNEWTADGKLRQPIFVGVRDDKDPREVRREPVSLAGTTAADAGRRRGASRAHPRAGAA